MLTWEQWKEINSDKIQHIVGYEERFVDEILSKIPKITPSDVIAQYHFIDANQRNRYIDFMIKNDVKGYSLPIELDGYDKLNNKGYARFNDFLERQNDLIQLFGIVLRYTNKKAFLEQQKVIDEISQALKTQSSQKVTEQTKQEQINLLIAEYEEKIALFENEKRDGFEKLSNPSKELEQAKTELELFKLARMEEFNQLQNQINNVKQEQSQQLSSIKRHIYLIMGVVAIALIVAIVFLNGKTGVSTTENEALSISETSRAVNASSESEHLPSSTSENTINANQARFHVGENKTVCGKVVHIHEFEKGLYLNLDKAYPNTPLTIVVWDRNRELISKAKASQNKKVCVWGEIRQYNNQTQISLNSEKQLR